jgi:hypothetical protein
LNFIAVTGWHGYLADLGGDLVPIFHHALHPFGLEAKVIFALQKHTEFSKEYPKALNPIIATKLPANPAGTAGALLTAKLA